MLFRSVPRLNVHVGEVVLRVEEVRADGARDAERQREGEEERAEDPEPRRGHPRADVEQDGDPGDGVLPRRAEERADPHAEEEDRDVVSKAERDCSE